MTASAAQADIVPEPPATLRRLTFIVALERFGFGALLATLALFLISPPSRGGLGWSSATAIFVAGMATASTQLAVLLGGWAIDRWPVRARRVGSVGILATGTGLLLLAGLSSITLVAGRPPTLAAPWLVLALASLTLGNGLFKPTITLAVAGCEATASGSRDGAFTSFWLGIQMGVLGASIVAGLFGSYFDWSLAFLVIAIGPGLALLLWRRSTVRIEKRTQDLPTGNPAASPQGMRIVLIACAVFSLYTVGLGQLFGLFPVIFETRGERALFGFLIPTPWITALETAIIVAATPLVVRLWHRLRAEGREPNSLAKFAIALLLCGVAFLLLGISYNAFSSIPLVVSVALMMLVGLSEIPMQPVGLSLVSRLASPSFRGRALGLWFVGSTLGNFLSGVVGAYAAMAGATLTSLVLAGLLVSSALWMWYLSRRYAQFLRDA